MPAVTHIWGGECYAEMNAAYTSVEFPPSQQSICRLKGQMTSIDTLSVGAYTSYEQVEHS